MATEAYEKMMAAPFHGFHRDGVADNRGLRDAKGRDDRVRALSEVDPRGRRAPPRPASGRENQRGPARFRPQLSPRPEQEPTPCPSYM